ncbi:MAG: hypothetical protein A2297_08285 [Elusimicrobia bacterium RIFOXYB2_FULL_48_7]|nr:MAG: hypothetical protein A2297_08285 [Elusimicrobia bacterium RIFOXYB2_FULL_48_7]
MDKTNSNTELKLDSRGLPRGYGETRIVLMPRDPYCVFAYWELSPVTRDELIKKYVINGINNSTESLNFALRVYDITGLDFTGENADKYFTIEINPVADNWYITIPEPNKDLFVSIGLMLPGGIFTSITRSNLVRMPRYGVSSLTDEQWMSKKNTFDKIAKLSLSKPLIYVKVR